MTQTDETTLVALLKELIAAQILREEEADRFAFRHALTQPAIYNKLLTRERKTLHRAVLAVMTTLSPSAAPPTLSELAHHAYAAEAWAQLLSYAQRAGNQALAFYAPQAALEHFAQALHAANQLQQAPPPALLRACGQAYHLTSDFANARQSYEQALTLARATPDGAAEWQCLLDLGTLAQEEDYDRAGEHFHAALALARTRQEPTALAHTLNWLGRWHFLTPEPNAPVGTPL